jgi:uncharacterized membrane protein
MNGDMGATEFAYGPVEFVLVGFEGDRPGEPVIEAIRDIVDAGAIRLLDLVVVTHSEDDTITAVEIEDVADDYGLGTVELEASGLAADQDIQQFAAEIPPGTSAALAVVELLWAKRLAEKLADAHGFVIHSDRIPAPIVNAALTELAAQS